MEHFSFCFLNTGKFLIAISCIVPMKWHGFPILVFALLWTVLFHAKPNNKTHPPDYPSAFFPHRERRFLFWCSFSSIVLDVFFMTRSLEELSCIIFSTAVAKSFLKERRARRERSMGWCLGAERGWIVGERKGSVEAGPGSGWRKKAPQLPQETEHRRN